MLNKYYLGGSFWAPIPHKRYQSASGFASKLLCNSLLMKNLNLELQWHNLIRNQSGNYMFNQS